MRGRVGRSWLLWLLALGMPVLCAARQTGGIDGRLVGADGEGIGGVTATIEGGRQTQLTDNDGRYRLRGVPAGSQRVLLVLGEHVEDETVDVIADSTIEVETRVDWSLVYAETVTVEAASRIRQRIVEAPAAVTALTHEEIERGAVTGQLPKLLGGTPGAQLTQSGLYDFNLNVRGFNSLINKRVLVRIDGRDPSAPIQLGTQEWASVAFPLDELERVELVRGPVTALYGAGAYNGVLNLITKAPSASPGGKVRLALGELETRRLEGRHAGVSEDGRWGYKVVGGYQESETFTRSRDERVEYRPDLLALELIPLPGDRVEIEFASARLDRSFGGTAELVVEAGTGNFEGTTAQTDLGRFYSSRTERPWARFNLNLPRWNLLGYTTARDTDDIRGLASNSMGYLDTETSGLEVQTVQSFGDHRGRVIAGGSVTVQDLDTADPAGVQTILPEPVDTDHRAVFVQGEIDLTASLHAVASLRWDDGTLHDAQWSPRVALVYGPVPEHTLRLSYGSAFQRPAVPDLFLDLALGPPVELGPLEASLAPVLGGVPLGFDAIPFVAKGNRGLRVEEVTSFEVGYRGILGNRVYVTASVYRNELENFVSGLLPQVGTSLGRLNGDYEAYQPPPELSPEASAAVLSAIDAALPAGLRPYLSVEADGSPVFVFLSHGNFGLVETRGLELSAGAALGTRLRLETNYTYSEFEVREGAPEFPLGSNTPEHQLTGSVTYQHGPLDASLQVQWIDRIDWISGVYAGPVPSTTLAQLGVGYRLSERWRLGLNVSNLFDNQHYQTFGGDLLGRRALADVSVSW